MDDTITLDVTTLTLGEAAAVELASGLTLKELLRSSAARKMLALFVLESRSSGPRRSWSELSNLRLLDASSSTPLSASDGVSATSSG